jgi:hypothetical protein
MIQRLCRYNESSPTHIVERLSRWMTMKCRQYELHVFQDTFSEFTICTIYYEEEKICRLWCLLPIMNYAPSTICPVQFVNMYSQASLCENTFYT